MIDWEEFENLRRWCDSKIAISFHLQSDLIFGNQNHQRVSDRIFWFQTILIENKVQWGSIELELEL